MNELRHYNVSPAYFQSQNAKIIYKDQEMQRLCQNLHEYEQTKYDLEPSDSEIEYQQGVVDLFLNDEAMVKHTKFMQNRKKNVKSQLLQCEGFY